MEAYRKKNLIIMNQPPPNLQLHYLRISDTTTVCDIKGRARAICMKLGSNRLLKRKHRIAPGGGKRKNRGGVLYN